MGPEGQKKKARAETLREPCKFAWGSHIVNEMTPQNPDFLEGRPQG